MNKAAWLCGVAVLTGLGFAAAARGADDKPPAAWEYKAVQIRDGAGEATKQLNDLAADGWEYVGPLGNGMVAFKRRIRSASDVELEKLQGTWVLVSREEGGVVVRFNDDSITFIVTGNKWAWKDKGVVVQAGVWKLVDIDKAAKSYDNLATEGFNEGGTAKGIYLVEGDTLKYCEGATRPTEFTTKEGDGRYCCTWKRAKK